MNRHELRRVVRTAVVGAVTHAPSAPLLAARRRYDHTLATTDAAARPPALLRLARLRPVPAAVRAFTPPGRPDVRFVNAASGVTQWTYWLGMDDVARFGAGPRVWEALCARAAEVVEIGANIGFYTIPGAKAAGGVYRAYEPHPESAAVLRSNLAENEITNVDVHEAAVVAGPAGFVDLTVPPAFDAATPGNATLVPEFSGGSVVRVRGEPMAEALGGCDLLKLDVEGLEAALFESAWDDLVRLRPAIMVEVHDVNEQLRALLPGLVEASGGRAYAMRRASLTSLRTEELGRGPLFDRYGTWDYLLVPSGREHMVDALEIDAGAAR